MKCDRCKKAIGSFDDTFNTSHWGEICSCCVVPVIDEESEENAKLKARVRELERFENIINETGRKFWPAIGTPECRNAIHDPEQRGVFDVLVFINKLLNENSKTE